LAIKAFSAFTTNGFSWISSALFAHLATLREIPRNSKTLQKYLVTFHRNPFNNPMPKSQKTAKEPSFEHAMERLEKTVEQMEARNLPLEQIIEKYEEGIKLVELCEKKLSAAEKKIEFLTRTKSGKVEVTDFQADKEKNNQGEVDLF
jgi:exodeoxyribonuclease VII small subunit